MCFVHIFPIKLEHIVYYLLPDAFTYVVSTHFLHAEYDDSCLITYLINIFIIKRLCNLGFIKDNLSDIY